MSRPRRELPLPGDAAPQSRRPLPGTPGDNDSKGPAPPLPSRGGGPPSRKAPPTPEPPSRSVTSDDGDIYNEADVGGEVYQDCEPEQEEYTEFDVGAEVEEEPQETYDEFEVQAVEEQETYEISDVGPEEVYQDMDSNDGGLPPPPPPSRPIPPPPKSSSPTPPPPPPPQSKRVPLEKKTGTPRPPVQRQKPGGLDLSEVLSKRSNLRKVGSTEERPISTNDVKVYSTGDDMHSKLQMFRQKEEAAGLVSPTRTSAAPKIVKTPSTESSPVPKSPGFRGALPPTPVEKPALPSKPADLPPPPPLQQKSSNGRDSPELPPPPKLQEVQPPPPPKTKDSYTEVDPTTKSNGSTGQNAPLVPNGNQNDWPDDYDDDDGEIYDDVAAALVDPLGVYPWYHGELEREEGNKKLKKLSKDGCFLMRKCSNKQKAETQPYTLMVFFSGYNYNLKVRFRSDKKYALGEEKADEVTFETVPELISHHQSNDVILVHKTGKQYSTLLTLSPS